MIRSPVASRLACPGCRPVSRSSAARPKKTDGEREPEGVEDHRPLVAAEEAEAAVVAEALPAMSMQATKKQKKTVWP